MSDAARVLYLVRHGQAGRSNDGYPGYDPALTTLGTRQAQAVAKRLVGVGITHVFSSPFRRAWLTAIPIAQALGLKICIEPGLGEIQQAKWFTAPPVFPHPSALLQAHGVFDPDYVPRITPAHPEDKVAVWDRIARAADAILADSGPIVLLVGHGCSVNGVRRHLLGQSRNFNAETCCISRVFRSANTWEQDLDGDPAHLIADGVYLPDERFRGSPEYLGERYGSL